MTLRAAIIFAVLAGPAIAEPRIIEPPAFYVHPFYGRYVEHVVSYQEAQVLCHAYYTGRFDIGCAKNVGSTCYVIRYDYSDNPGEIVPREEAEKLRRHELAHCNGWPADHRGKR